VNIRKCQRCGGDIRNVPHWRRLSDTLCNDCFDSVRDTILDVEDHLRRSPDRPDDVCGETDGLVRGRVWGTRSDADEIRIECDKCGAYIRTDTWVGGRELCSSCEGEEERQQQEYEERLAEHRERHAEELRRKLDDLL
jgi:hypothetical protein